MVDSVRDAFNVYRSSYPVRAPNLATLRFDDELRLISVNEGRRDLTVAPSSGIATSSLPRSRGGEAAAKYLWVVGSLDVPYGLEAGADRSNLGRGYLAHTNLTGGVEAHAGGEMWFQDASTVVINGGSGRYPPRSIDELEEVASALKRCGYRAGHMGYDEGTGTFARFLEPGREPNWV